ncbi:MAG: AI-2E family transporter [Acidobacteriota bacterium]|nr:AI-2E family transporter [Acidobacteriota bacterium]
MTPIIENRTFTHRVLIVVAVVTLAILLVWGAIYVIDVILLVFAAALLAVFLRGLAELTRRYTRLSEGLSVLLVAVLLIGILALAITLLAPSVTEEARHLRQELPKSAQKAGDYIRQFSWGKTIIEQLPSPDEVIQKIDASSLLTRVGGYFSSTVGAIANFFIVILLAIYLATEPQTYIRGFSKLFTFDKRQRVIEVFNAIGETLQMWLVGKVASMLFIGLLTWIGLWIIGVPLSFTLGLIAGLLSFIPNFGPILSAVPAILLAFIDSPVSALYVIGLYVGVQLIESNVVTPIIERETVELPPALTIVSQLALSVLIGGLGLVLATPILAVIMVLVQTVYIEDVLGDKKTEVKEKDLDEDAEKKA